MLGLLGVLAEVYNAGLQERRDAWRQVGRSIRLAEARDEIAALLRRRAGKQPGSRAWKALNRRVAKAYRRAARRSDNWARSTARALVARYGVIVLEDLNLKNMTRSARSGHQGEPRHQRGR